MADLPDLGGSEADHLRLLLEEGGIGAWELDVRSGAAWRNLKHDRIFGYESLLPEWTYEQFLDHVLPEDREMVDARYRGALERGETWSFECRIRRADGEQRWISATGRPIRDEDGQTLRLIGHVIDISHVKRNEEMLRTVLNEMNHRVRNTLTVIQSLATMSFPDHVSIAEGRRNFSARLEALVRTHSLLTADNWKGAPLAELVENALAPYLADASRAEIAGPEVSVPARAAVSLAMTLNELATNALKHGALGAPGGRVSVRWTRQQDGICELVWTERGGPPVSESADRGFGMKLIGSLVPSDLRGESEIRFEETGLRCRLSFPIPAEAGPAGEANAGAAARG